MAITFQATQVTPRPTVDVAVRFTYNLQEWVNSPWPQEPPGNNEIHVSNGSDIIKEANSFLT